MPSVNEFKKSWDKSGRPRTVDGLAQVLRDAGLSEDQMTQVFESQGLTYQSPLKYPDPEEVQEPEAQAEPEEQIPVPIGFIVKTKSGNDLKWLGNQWRTHKGTTLNKQYVPKVNAEAQRQLKRQMLQKQKEQEETQRKKDAEYDFEDTDYEPQEEPKVSSEPEQKTQDMQKLTAKYKQIANSQHRDHITRLLAMNDPIANRAIDVIMAGQTDAVISELTTKS